MKQNKWQYQTVDGVFLDENKPFDFAALKAAMRQHERGELLLRKEINWDTDQMRKFFHGPVRKFILEERRKQGNLMTADQLKDDLKQMYGPKVSRKNLSGMMVEEPKSTGDYTFDDYVDFLNSINLWCIEELGYEFPPAEKVE